MKDKNAALGVIIVFLLSGCAVFGGGKCPNDPSKVTAGGDYSGCNFQRFDFSNMDLTEANFSGALLEKSNFLGAKIAYAGFSGANLRFSNLEQVNAQGANFSNANLAYSDLAHGDFRNADFTNASIYKTRGSGIKLYGAKFNHTYWVNGKLCDYKSIGKCIYADK